MTSCAVTLRIGDATVDGEVALVIAPGTVASECHRLLRDALGDELVKASDALGAVISAAIEKYARPLPGKDTEGRTVYAVSARVEGGRLVPAHGTKLRRRG